MKNINEIVELINLNLLEEAKKQVLLSLKKIKIIMI
jgi:hypothetical protein